MLRIYAIFLLFTCTACASTAGECASLERRGEALVKDMCAGCHAIGRTGQSPHLGAPAFRTLDSRVDLDRFSERLRQGLMSDHPDMPTFRFTREDARAFIAYLRSIQTERDPAIITGSATHPAADHNRVIDAVETELHICDELVFE